MPAPYTTDRYPAIVRSSANWTTPRNCFLRRRPLRSEPRGRQRCGVANRLAVSFDLPFPSEAVIYSVQVWVKIYNASANNTILARLTQGGTTTNGTQGYKVVPSPAAAVTWLGWDIPRALTADQLADPLLEVDLVAAGPGGTGNPSNGNFVDMLFIRVSSDHGIAIAAPPAAVNITQEAAGANQWSNPTNAWRQDNTGATAFPSGTGAATRKLWGASMTPNVPAEAVILGLRLRAKIHNAGTPANACKVVGSVSTTTRETGNAPAAGTAPNEHTWLTMASSFKDLWGFVWTPADVNAASFTPQFHIVNTSGASISQPNLDAIETTILYKESPKQISFEHGMTVAGGLNDVELYRPLTTHPRFMQIPAFDDFNDGVLAGMWAKDAGSGAVTGTETAGTYDFTAATTAPTGGVSLLAPTGDLRQTETIIRIDQRANLASFYLVLYILCWDRANTYVQIDYQNGATRAARTLDGVSTVLNTLTGTAPTHLRIVDHYGQMSWQYTTGTADQVRLYTATWITVASELTAVPMGNAAARIDGAKNGGAGAAATFKVGDFAQRLWSTGGEVLDRFQTSALDTTTNWTLTSHANAPVTQVANTGLQFAIGTGAGVSEVKLYGRNLTSSRTQVRIQTPVAQTNVPAPSLRWEKDANNWLEIRSEAGSVYVNEVVAGTLAYRGGGAGPATHLAIRALAGKVFYSYSTNGGFSWTQLYTGPAPFSLLYIFVKLLAGRTTGTGTAATLTLTDFDLTAHNVIYGDFSQDDTTNYSKWALGGASLPTISGGVVNCPVPVRTTTQPSNGLNSTAWNLDHREGQHQCKLELPAGGVGLQAWLSIYGQLYGTGVPNEGGNVPIAQFAFVNSATEGRNLIWYAINPVTGAAVSCPGPEGSEGVALPIGQDFVWVHILFDGGRIRFSYTMHPDGWYRQEVGTYTPHWPASRRKIAGMVQMLATADVSNTAGTVKFDNYLWEARGQQPWPVYEGLVSSITSADPAAVDQADRPGSHQCCRSPEGGRRHPPRTHRHRLNSRRADQPCDQARRRPQTVRVPSTSDAGLNHACPPT